MGSSGIDAEYMGALVQLLQCSRSSTVPPPPASTTRLPSSTPRPAPCTSRALTPTTRPTTPPPTTTGSNLDHGTSTETSSQVGWAGKDPTKMVVVHEVVTFLLKDLLDTFSGSRESVEDFNNGSTLLHRDNSHLIFFIDPDEEVLGFIVEDTTGIWPVTTATG